MLNYNKMDKPQMFQWVRGDQMGKIVTAVTTINDDNMEFFVFEDGSQCNTQLVGEWILPISNPAEAPYLPEPEPIKAPRQEEVVKKEVKTQPPAELNPVYDLLEMSKKKKTKMQITLDLEMPSDELIKVIVDSYNGGDTHIANYLVRSVNNDSVMDQIRLIVKQKVDAVTKKKRGRNE